MELKISIFCILIYYIFVKNIIYTNGKNFTYSMLLSDQQPPVKVLVYFLLKWV